MMKTLVTLLLICLSSSAAAEYRAAVFLPRSSYFWERVESFAQAAADDVGLKLEIYNAEDSPEKMLAQVRQSAEGGVDAILFMEYRGIGEAILNIAEQYKVPALIFNTGLDDSSLLPRVHYPHWLGGVVPDDRKAGLRLATQLIGVAAKQGTKKFRILAFSGFDDSRAHARRFEGLKNIVTARDDVSLVEVIADVRDPVIAADAFETAMQAHSDINIVWSYYDRLALTAAKRARALGVGDKIIFGGIDWSPDALAGVSDSLLAVDIGGHVFDAAQAVIMIFDYLNGRDFAEENLLFDSNMLAVNKKNGFRFNYLLSAPGSIHYKALSKTHNPKIRQYRFDFVALSEAEDLLIDLTEDERQWLTKHPIIDIGVDGTWPPIDFMDDQGNHRGIAAEYLRIIGGRLGVKFNPVKSGSFNEMLGKVVSGELAVGSTISYKQERTEDLWFTEAFFQVRKVIVVQKDEGSIKQIDDLKGKTVAVENGFLTMRQLQQMLPEINLLPVESSILALQQVSWGKADAYIGSQSVASWLIRENQLSNLHFIGGAGLGSGPQNFAISQKAPDWKIFQSILDKALVSISDEERNALKQRWLGDPGFYSSVPAIELSNDQINWLQEHPSIRIGIDPLWPPVEYYDDQGSYQGMSSDIIAIVANRLGIQVAVEQGISWPQVHKKIAGGEIDVLPAVSQTDMRSSYLNFTQPYLEFPQVIFVNDASSFFLNGLDDLRGRTIAIERGYSSEEKLAANYPEINQIQVDTTLDALKMLASGKVDAYLGNLTIGSYLITEHGLSNIKIAAPTPFSNKLTIGVRKDWPELVPILQKALDSIGPVKMAEIRQKWMSVRYEHEVNYTKLWWIVGIALLVLVSVLIWLGYTRRVNKVLHQQRERLRLTLESAKLGSWELILNNQVLESGSCNPYFAQHHGLGDELSLNSLEDFYQGAEAQFREALIASFSVYLSGSVEVFEQEYKTTKGQWILSQGRVFERDREGVPTRIIGTSRDITERKKSQVEREKFYALLVDALESIDAAFVMFDAEGGFVICNIKYRQVHPEIADKLMPGAKYIDLLTHRCKLTHANELTGQSIAEWVREQLTIDPSHLGNCIEEFNGRWMLSRNYQTSDGGTVTLIYDITELKHTQHALEKAKNEAEFANNELLSANEKLRELDKLKSMFIASISHELRTPLNSIIGFSSMMMSQSYGELNPKYKDYVTRINQSGQHLLSLITDIIDISKIESGRIDLMPSVFDVHEVVNNAVASVQRQAEAKGLALEIVMRQDFSIRTDKRRLLQCLLNILSNAIKYSDQGVVSLTVEKQGDDILFALQDTGIGIASEDMARLFVAFDRINSHLKVQAGGTGLGLYLTKKIVTEILQGQMGVESTLNVGSRFWFTVPANLML